MSTPEIYPAPTPARAPRLSIRIAWWLAIYLVGAATTCIVSLSSDEHRRSASYVLMLFGVLAWDLPYLFPFVFLGSVDPANQIFSWSAFFWGYGAYLLNLIAVLFVARRITFLITLAVLVVLIGLSFFGFGFMVATFD